MANAMAADAHKAVKAKPGEIVLLRNVSARPAVHQAPPGMALIANPSPRSELARSLGTGELSDDDYASVNANSPATSVRQVGTVQHSVANALGDSLGSVTGNGRSGVHGMSDLVGAPVGTVNRATSNIGNQIQGAFSQLPGVPSAPTGGH